jgi:hypothetical protein
MGKESSQISDAQQLQDQSEEDEDEDEEAAAEEARKEEEETAAAAAAGEIEIVSLALCRPRFLEILKNETQGNSEQQY